MKPVAVGVVELGPSGSGKSNLAEVFYTISITPDRVRSNPRDSEDIHYLSQMSFAGILSLLEGEMPIASFGGPLEIKIYTKAALFKVRGEDQVLFRPKLDLECRAKKVEIYGPVLLELLKRRGSLGWVDDLLPGALFVIILNPWTRPLSEVKPEAASDPTSPDGKVLLELLEKRNEKPENIQKRITNIVEELSAWQSIASASGESLHVLEAVGWPFAEHTYPKPGDPGRVVRLRQAKDAIVSLAKASLTDEDNDLFERLLDPATTGTGSRLQARERQRGALPSDHFQKWTIYFACTLPGEPGCGCPDNDFLGEHHFEGTRRSAEAAAERISREIYAGDFRWWIEATTTQGGL